MLKFIPHVDLEQRATEVLEDVYNGQAAVIEQPGKPSAIIVDFVDYLIMQAAMRYHIQPIIVDSDEALAELETLTLSPMQERYNWAVQCYLAEIINLSRAAEILDISWFELRMRCLHLGLPLYVGPIDRDEIQSDIHVALGYSRLCPV